MKQASSELAGAQLDLDSEPSVSYTGLPPEWCLPLSKQPHRHLKQTEVSYQADIFNQDKKLILSRRIPGAKCPPSIPPTPYIFLLQDDTLQMG